MKKKESFTVIYGWKKKKESFTVIWMKHVELLSVPEKAGTDEFCALL